VSSQVDESEPRPEPADRDEEFSEERIPIGRCPRCSTPFYTEEGFCGGCKPGYPL
jgi:uncharacterized OB-fold protein